MAEVCSKPPSPSPTVLMQDIAVVPFLVLLPLVESNELEGQSTMTLVYALGPTALKTLGGLGLLLLGGRFVLRRLFQLVAESRSDETFVALCLLTVTGASLCTQRLGFSDTLGAFVAGVLLAETNYRTQVCRRPRPGQACRPPAALQDLQPCLSCRQSVASDHSAHSSQQGCSPPMPGTVHACSVGHCTWGRLMGLLPAVQGQHAVSGNIAGGAPFPSHACAASCAADPVPPPVCRWRRMCGHSGAFSSASSS